MDEPIKINTMVRIVRLTETNKTPGGRAGKFFDAFAQPIKYPQSPWPREAPRSEPIRLRMGVDNDGLGSTHPVEFRQPEIERREADA
jgi:hypothetical protein